MKTLIPFLILCLIATCNAELRTWTAVNGKEVEADFISNIDGQVTLKMKTGKIFKVPLNKLSKLDIEFIKAQSKSLKDNIVGKIITLKIKDTEFQWIFNANGVMLYRVEGNVKDDGLNYQIKGNEVQVLLGNEVDGVVLFPSLSPKAGDQVEVGPEYDRQKGIIVKIEAAGEVLNDPIIKNNQLEAVSGESNLKFEIKGNSVTITGCDKNVSGMLLVPSIIEGKPVTKIGDFAFSRCRALTSIMIPNSVSSIEAFAFSDCSKLTEINIPNGVTYINLSTFMGCRSLENITIPNSVTHIGSSAFMGCTSLKKITIPISSTWISDKAFNFCKSLLEIKFLGDAPNVGEDVFNDSSPIIYRKPEANGWGDTFGGRPVKLISEKP